MLKNLLTKQAIRVILSLLVGLFIGLKSPEAVDLVCTVADVLSVDVQQCEVK
jgi:hypothetical protein